MTWQENESTGEEWKGDNYQPEHSFDGDPSDLFNRLINLLNEASQSLKDIHNVENVEDMPAPKGTYILDGEIVRPAKTYGEYLEGFKIDNRRVDETVLPDKEGNISVVSTVFLSLDHSFGTGTPILFETLGVHNGEEFCMKRYPTYEAAITGHRETVEELKEIIKKDT